MCVRVGSAVSLLYVGDDMLQQTVCPSPLTLTIFPSGWEPSFDAFDILQFGE